MKLGIILSIVIVVALVVIAAYNMLGVPDEPTAATRPEKLLKLSLDPKLPVMWSPDNAQASANAAYGELLKTYMDNRRELDEKDPPSALVDQWAVQLIDAANAGQISQPFLDDRIPMVISADPDFGGALEAVDAVLINKRGMQAADHGEESMAYKIGMGGFALGQRLFEKSVRLDNRRMGLILMADAGGLLYKDKVREQAITQPDLDKRLTAWADSINPIRGGWEEKIQLIRTPHPNVADLMNIAKNDKDLTFRVEATLYLGIAKLNPGSNANHRAIVKTIEAARNDPDPMISSAAQAADALTLEEMRKLK